MSLWVEALILTGENSVNGYDWKTCNRPRTTTPNKLLFFSMSRCTLSFISKEHNILKSRDTHLPPVFQIVMDMIRKLCLAIDHQRPSRHDCNEVQHTNPLKPQEFEHFFQVYINVLLSPFVLFRIFSFVYWHGLRYIVVIVLMINYVRYIQCSNIYLFTFVI